MVNPSLPHPPPPSLSPTLTDTFTLSPCQSAEARLYTFSEDTKTHLRKFRLGTSRASDPQAVICMYVSLPHLHLH